MRVKDRSNVTQRAAGNSGDLCFGAADKCQPGYPSSPQVIERHTSDAGGRLRLAPGRAEPVLRPWLAVAVHQDHGAALCRTIKCSLERCAHREAYARACL